MQLKRNQNKIIRPLVATLIATVLIIGFSFLYFYKYNNRILGWTPKHADTKNLTTNSANSINYQPATNAQKNGGEQIKESARNNSLKVETSGNISVTISAINQTASTLQIRAFVSAIENNSICTLIMTKDGQTINQTVNTQLAASTSTCKGFDVALSTLSSGNWHIKIYYNGLKFKGSAEKDIVIK